MVLVALVPLSMAADGDTHLIIKGPKGPRASAMTWEYQTGPDPGVWTGYIVNNGLRSLVVDVYDNTTGALEEISHERIRFAAYDAYPTGTYTTMPVQMDPNGFYEITVIPNGPRGSSAELTDQFTTLIPPVAIFSVIVDLATVHVDASGSYDANGGTIESYEWDWDDGTAMGSGMTASHTYTMDGVYTITLTVTDNDGLTDSDSQTVPIDVPNQMPVAIFTWSAVGLELSVDASDSYDLDGTIDSYDWNWGDSTAMGSGVTATHTYAMDGTYTVVLTVTDNEGGTGTASEDIPVSEIVLENPVAIFTFSVTDYTVNVDGSDSYDPDGTVESYAWNWDDGTAMGSGMTASHTYAMEGVYTVTLTVTDNDALTGSVSHDVAIDVNQPPTASFTYSVTDLAVDVDGSGSSDTDGTIDSYAWNWGDSTAMGSGVTASHTYAAGGTYTITLTVTDDDGATDSQSQDVTVVAPITQKLSFEISNMFEIYLKSTDYTKLGRWTDTLGVNAYWALREASYGEFVIKNTYPFMLGNDPFPSATTPDIHCGNMISTWYRMYVTAENMPGAATGPGKDPIFVPVLGNIALPGGWVNISWYSTYFITGEMTALRAGTHYGNTYYGVPIRATPLESADDGYWHELQGQLSFTRDACKKFLGMAATGDLEDEFAIVGEDIGYAWFDDWMLEGSTIYDIYTGYEYSNDIRYLGFIVDPELADTDPNTLHLRMYSVSWGNEAQLIRYLEAAKVLTYWQGYPDDWYLNISIGPEKFDLEMRTVIGWHMTAWKDQGTFAGAAWMLEPMHLDYLGTTTQHNDYASPYDQYDPDKTDLTRISWMPGALNFGNPVSYWICPFEWDLMAEESLVVKLPTGMVAGIEPYAGTTDKWDATKRAEWMTHYYEGELTLGTGYPGDLSSYYDPVTKTITMIGPIDFPHNPNPAAPLLNWTGAPMFVFDVIGGGYTSMAQEKSPDAASPDASQSSDVVAKVLSKPMSPKIEAVISSVKAD